MDQGGNIEKKDNSLLIIILSFLILLVIILATIITINFVNKNPGNNPAQNSDTSLETILTNFEEKYPLVEESDYENVISAYQSAIDSSPNEEKTELLTSRIYFLIDYDIENRYEELALKDAYATEEILHDINSATNLLNVATKYDLTELYNEYSLKYDERLGEISPESSEAYNPSVVDEEEE
ncbi:hypothetical protein IIY24_00040 [Candidatus Saccharibacteria bacterium]|nr:hypothetical protein [Candidatus Saccharibacteria bacterium]